MLIPTLVPDFEKLLANEASRKTMKLTHHIKKELSKFDDDKSV